LCNKLSLVQKELHCLLSKIEIKKTQKTSKMFQKSQKNAPALGLTDRAKTLYWLAISGTAVWVLAGIIVVSMFPHKKASGAQDWCEDEQKRTAWVEQTYVFFFKPFWLIVNWILLPAFFAYGVYTRLAKEPNLVWGNCASTGAKLALLFATYAEIVKTLTAAVSFAWLWSHASASAIPSLKMHGDRKLMEAMSEDGTAYSWIVIATLAGFVAGLLEALVIWNLTYGDDALNFRRVNEMYTLAKADEDVEQEEQAKHFEERDSRDISQSQPFVRKV